MGLLAEELSDPRAQDYILARTSNQLVVLTEIQILGKLHEALPSLNKEEVSRVRGVVCSLLARKESGKVENDVEDEPFEFKTAKYSPLPAITEVKFDPNHPNRTLDVKETREAGIYVLGLLDWDHNLNKAKSKNSITLHDFAKFMGEREEKFVRNGGNLQFLKMLISYCNKWQIQRQRVEQGVSIEDIRKELHMGGNDQLIEYEEGIKRSGTYSALAFTGMNIKKLEAYGREFMQTEEAGELYDYTHDVIQIIRDHGFEPVVVTGAPDFLLPGILEKVNVRFGKGMTYEVDDDGKILGEWKEKPGKQGGNMGVAEQKDKYAKGLTRRDYGVGFGIGDSEGDMGLFSSAIYKDRAKEDVNGGAVISNASNSARGRLKCVYTRHFGDDRIKMIEPEESYRGKHPDKRRKDMVEAVMDVMGKVLEPLHDHLKGKTDAAVKEKLETYLENRKNKNKKDPNLENIKRLRDALRCEGLNEEQIRSVLEEFFPKIIVDDVMKRHMLDTRNEGDLTSYLESLGVLNQEEIEKIVIANRLRLEQLGSIPSVVIQRRQTHISTIPAASETETAETEADGVDSMAIADTKPPETE
ncbi:haloacid dehalogenase-like hydrolase [Patescibacteria group bacterium]|nr:haloacid dehalogenase-like hydrolase [Patescibacteria group bacterium]MBU1015772.1 haloacid dehalogenase-like hydrolase [Patescibacteria group bacterium]MBU1685180.1 haloacid dehalogenase-like hydrolase [Patescibacteria group bacterium]MBU1938316.1 haloacid dehalogenase-like hydrolase [Patescibacteria group bacterium]